MYTTFIADDELIIRQGLRCILDWEELGFQIIGEAANGADALDFIIKNNPDLVLLDIRMPQILGTEIVRRAKEQGFTGKFIILSGFTDFEYTQAAIHYGVDYYLTKPIDWKPSKILHSSLIQVNISKKYSWNTNARHTI